MNERLQNIWKDLSELRRKEQTQSKPLFKEVEAR